MPTPAQVDEQIKLEREQISGGLHKLNKDTKTLEQKEYASATIYGRCSIDELLPKVIARINTKFEESFKNANGYQKGLLINYIMRLDAEASAAIAVKRTFDKVFSQKKYDDRVTKVTEAIGRSIEEECQMRHYESVAPGLLHVLKENYWHESKGTKQRLTSIQTIINRYDIPKWESWNSTTRSKVGGWLLERIMEVTHWFQRLPVQRGKKKDSYITCTDAFTEYQNEIIKVAELFSPLTLPMFIEPRKWTKLEKGGYYLNALTNCHEMVRRGAPLSIQGKIPIEFLNKIQKVGYRLNPFTVKVAEILDERKISVGKFRPIIDHELPNKPLDIDSNPDSKQAYRRASAKAYDLRSQEFRRSCRTRVIMNTIPKFKDRDRYYIPWSFDYRGRTYPIPSFLTPQDSDFGKSLIRFADEAEMTLEAEEWLSFQVATCYGLDKATMEERLSWTQDNLNLIKRIALDPIDCISEWEVAEEPWQFLAACDEYYHCVLIKDRKSTGLCVAIDATCSGLQILAALAADKRTARLVNVLPPDNPQDRPKDAYKVVAEAAKPHIPEYLHKVWDRKSVKRTVMTIPYNAKPFSNRSYIREALKEKKIDISNEELTDVVKAVRNSMKQEFPGPMKVMEWIESEVRKAITDRNMTELVWKTPSGFIVTQRLMKRHWTVVELKLLGRCQIKVADGHTNEVDLMHHKNATAPNLIHSLDASLLHKAGLKFNNPIALIHDSVLCRATDMTTLSKVVRETYMELFTNTNVLEDFATAIGAKTDKLPIIGDLEHSDVIDSTYFFC